MKKEKKKEQLLSKGRKGGGENHRKGTKNTEMGTKEGRREGGKDGTIVVKERTK